MTAKRWAADRDDFGPGSSSDGWEKTVCVMEKPIGKITTDIA
jgi:hypothetical protein